MNTALVFQSFFDANRYLRRKPVANRIDGSTNDGGEFGVDRNLSTHDNEHSRLEVAESYDLSAPNETPESSSSGFKPFDGLDALLKQKNNK